MYVTECALRCVVCGQWVSCLHVAQDACSVVRVCVQDGCGVVHVCGCVCGVRVVLVLVRCVTHTVDGVVCEVFQPTSLVQRARWLWVHIWRSLTSLNLAGT